MINYKYKPQTPDSQLCAERADGEHSLGIIANLQSAPAPSGQTPDEGMFTPSARVFRYALQSQARVLMPHERVAQCARRIVPGLAHVKVMHQPGGAHYQNLVRCGSVWMCPVCAAKITEARRAELGQALHQPGLCLALLTLTVRHTGADQLKPLLVGLTGACAALMTARYWQTIKAGYQLAGTIRALETTYGVHGWHPHLHFLLVFLSQHSTVTLAQLEADLRAHWLRVLARRGFDASWEHGLDLVTADTKVRDYITKFGHEPARPVWSLEHELTKTPTKKAALGGATPLELLALALSGEEAAGALWREYAAAFKGRHQLSYSPGLRDLLGLGVEQTDQELTAQDEPADVLALLTRDDWRRVLGNDIRAELLDVAARGDFRELVEFLASFGIYLPEPTQRGGDKHGTQTA